MKNIAIDLDDFNCRLRFSHKNNKQFEYSACKCPGNHHHHSLRPFVVSSVVACLAVELQILKSKVRFPVIDGRLVDTTKLCSCLCAVLLRKVLNPVHALFVSD